MGTSSRGHGSTNERTCRQHLHLLYRTRYAVLYHADVGDNVVRAMTPRAEPQTGSVMLVLMVLASMGMLTVDVQ